MSIKVILQPKLCELILFSISIYNMKDTYTNKTKSHCCRIVSPIHLNHFMAIRCFHIARYPLKISGKNTLPINFIWLKSSLWNFKLYWMLLCESNVLQIQRVKFNIPLGLLCTLPIVFLLNLKLCLTYQCTFIFKQFSNHDKTNYGTFHSKNIALEFLNLLYFLFV